MKHSVEGKKVLVTGGTGFIGSELVKGLLAAGAEVRSLDNNSRVAIARMDEGQRNVERITGDIRDTDTVREAGRGMDCVCHLAYINGTESFYASPELVLEVAVKGMMNILDACVAEGVRDFILASSSEVYQLPPVVPTDETTPLTVPDVLNPRFSYGGGKIISELLAVNYGRKFFDRTLIVRPHNVYGHTGAVIPYLLDRNSVAGFSGARFGLEGGNIYLGNGSFAGTIGDVRELHYGNTVAVLNRLGRYCVSHLILPARTGLLVPLTIGNMTTHP